MEEKRRGIGQDFIEIMALIAMFLDHFASTYVEQCRLGEYNLSDGMLAAFANPYAKGWMIAYLVLKIIGRIAFPIYAYNIAMGAKRTRNLRKYFIRVILLAVISEVPYDLAFFGKTLFWDNQNVLFSFSICLLTIEVNKFLMKKISGAGGKLTAGLLCCLAMALAYFLNVDYGIFGVLFVFIIYYFPEKTIKYLVASGLLVFYSIGELFGLSAVPLIMFCNGKRKRKLKIFFYLFYPIHLIVLFLLVRKCGR